LSVRSGNLVGFGALLTLWLLACMCANWANLPLLALAVPAMTPNAASG
jgi:hypothetical protein